MHATSLVEMTLCLNKLYLNHDDYMSYISFRVVCIFADIRGLMASARHLPGAYQTLI